MVETELSPKIEFIKQWLGTGSINVFGLPMSGKDTIGVKLAEALGGKFLSSGLIIRANEELTNQHYTDKGDLAPSNVFEDWVLPYFDKPELKDFPLILSSIGRWSGEEDKVMARAEKSGHPTKAVIILNISEADVQARWQNVAVVQDRGNRNDDSSPEVFQNRINEFMKKTAPVILRYRMMGLLVEVRADMDRERVFAETVNRLYDYAVNHP